MSKAESFIKYFKECIFEDSSDAIFAVTDAKNTYVKINDKELSTRDPIEFTELEKNEISTFINSTIKKIPSPSFWYGYPTLFVNKKGQKLIKPLFYFPISYNEENKPEIVSKVSPRINNNAFLDLGLENEQIKRFAEDIGLYEENTELNFSILGVKLKEIFPSFRYEQNQNNGIFFNGVVFSSEQSKYTQGLDFELNELLKTQTNYSNSCLNYYINPSEKKQKHRISTTISKILEVYELNENQNKAIKLSLNNPITVITGPPGTGKSQVVASLILNSILSNQKVLFASKNHKAIKVVEDKFNNLIGQPFLIRLGKQDNEGNNLRRNLINYLNWLNHTHINDEVEKEIVTCEKELNTIISKKTKNIKDIGKYRLIRNKALGYFRKNEEKYKNDENYLTLINKINKTKKVKRKNILNHRFRDIALYLKNMNGVHVISTFESLLEMDENYNHEIKELSARYIKLWFDALPNRFSDKQKQHLINLIEVLEGLMIPNLAKRQFLDLIERRNVLQKEVAGFLQSWCVTNLSIRGEIPLIEGFFDLLIIDEASQCDIASVIPLLYRSKRVVVLGDPFQLRHITTMNGKRSLELLNKYELDEYYNYVTRSFFDISKTIANRTSMVFLNEHFRSHADIISFSKDYPNWYNGNLLISTDYRRLNPQPGIEGHCIDWIDVKGSINQINSAGAFIKEEVNCVVEKVIEILDEYDFDGDIGVITPFRLQANKIREGLNGKLSEIDRNRVLVETVVKFQGDEKDIIIFSPVISENIPKGVKFYLEKTDNLLNVAITRARAKLIVIGNKTACLNCDIKHYKDFAEYVDGILSGRIQNVEQKSESIYEELLLKAMKDVDLDPFQQYVVGQYRLDFAIINDNIKLDIEVDGKKYHTDWTGERLKADILRNQRLQNLGWKVLRFWSYEIRDNIDYCIDRIKYEIKTL